MQQSVFRVILYIPLFCIVLFFTSCRNESVEKGELTKLLDRFKKTTVVFPDDLIKVQSGEESDFTLDAVPHLVFYFDSTNCASCEMHHIGGLYKFFNDERYGKEFDIIALFSPKEDDLNDILIETRYVPHDYPMYIDSTGSFAKTNTGIPVDRRFHVFLLDRENHPVYIGDPRNDEELEKLMWKHINHLNNN